MSLISDVLGARQRQTGGSGGVPLSLAFTADDVGWLMRSSYNYVPTAYAPEIALGLPAVMAVVNVLSNQLAAAPLHVYEPFEGGRRRVDSALANRLAWEWRVGETSFDARKRLMTIVLTQGVGYVWVERNERGGPIGLHVLSKRMVEEHVIDGRTIYKPCVEVIGLPDQMGSESVMRIKFMTDDEGCRYLNPLQRCWQAIRAGLAAQGISATYFENGMQPQVLFTSPIEDEDNAQALRNTLNNILNKMRKKGDSNILLPSGVDAKTISTDPRHAQLLELRRFAVQEVCRLYQVSPGIVQELSQGKYDNVEQGNLFFSQHALVPWAVQLEQEFRRVLWPAPSSRFAKLEMTGLLRGDYKTRTDGYARSIQSGFQTPNEIRELEDLPGLPGGDELYMQKQMVPIGREDEEEPVAAEEVAVEDEDEDDVDDVDAQEGDDDAESVEQESQNVENQVRNRLVQHRFGNIPFFMAVEDGPARLNGGSLTKESAMKSACRVEYDRAGRPVVCDDNLIGTGGMSREQWQDIVDRLDERRRRAREGRIRHLGFSELSRQSMMRHRECESLAIVVRDDPEPEPADREEDAESKEERADEATTGAVDIAGYGLRWEETTTLWEGGGDYPTYTESFTRGAFDGRMGDVRLLRNHGDLALARSSQGTMTTKEDKDGLAFTASLSMDDPAARGLATKLERGDVDKMSVGFSMRNGKSTFTIDDESNVVHEEILRVGELFEISAVNWPAYDSSEVSLKGRNPAPAERGTRTEHEKVEQRSAETPEPEPAEDGWDDDFEHSLRLAEADLASFELA